MKIFSSYRFLAPIIGVVSLAAGPALAIDLHDGQSSVSQLAPNASAVTSLVDRADGYHVIVTVTTAHDANADMLHQPPVVRFSSRILPGQTIALSMPNAAGPANTVLEITRRAERVAVETKHSVALVD
jgi:hypothetical protein